MAAPRSLLWLALWGCQPAGSPDRAGCPLEPPAPGEVRVTQLSCADQRIAGGEGRVGDFLVANASFSAVIRHPMSALSLAGVGGGTLIDAARWGQRDRLHEVAPLVGGGWLEVDTFEPLDDGYRVAGRVVSLPDAPAEAEGEWREVRWRIDPEEPILHLEGADGLWLHPAGGGELLGGQVVTGDVVYGHDGEVVEDLGGALRLAGVRRLRIGTLHDAWAWDTALPVEVEGEAPEAQRIALWRGDEVVGRLPVDPSGHFHGWIPPEVDGLQAQASGRAPSERLPPGRALQLQLGPPASLSLQPAWEGRPRHFEVRSRSEDGRRASWTLPPEGGSLALGEGVHTLSVHAGPSYLSRELRVVLGAEQSEPLGIRMEPLFDPGSRILIHTGWPADRARDWRGADLNAALQAAAAGYDYAVFTAPDNVPAVSTSAPRFPPLLTRNGVQLADPESRWEVIAWPYGRNPRINAGGAPHISGVEPEAALVLAAGSPGSGRLTQVDTGWLQAVGPPHTLRHRPHFVRLSHPGAELAAWQPWFDWLDAGALLIPVGPSTWVEVDDPRAAGIADVEQGLIPGRVSAGTGALLTLDVEGFGPGDVLSELLDEARLEVEVHGDPTLDQLALVLEGGRLLSLPLDEALDLATLSSRWMVAVAWSSTTDAWATTGPLWTGPP